MKLRGAFNPLVHIVIGAILIALSVWIAFALVGAKMELHSAQLDLHLLPVGLLLGLVVGVPVGIWRLRAIHKALPEVDGQFFLTQANVLRRFREGQNAVTLQQIGLGCAFALWLILTLHTDGRIVLFGTFVFYLLGQHLTGQVVPSARLFFEQRKISGSS